MSQSEDLPQYPKTKIVCTLGPETKTYKKIKNLILSGLTVARLNLSHETFADHRALFETVRLVSNHLDIPVGIMIDVPGPKYRTGPQSPSDILLNSEDRIVLTSRSVTGSPQMLGVYPSGLHDDVQAGGRILVDDGKVELRAVAVEGTEITCDVIAGGKITKGRGVVTPGRAPSLPFLDDRARDSLTLAAELGADFVALSNVTEAHDVVTARRLLARDGSRAFIISKIETAEAIRGFDEILDASDGIMVARGDMGVQIKLERVPLVQKDLIQKCNRAGKPVITATQMLESMILSPNPTRAEAADIANAIYDGTDAVMLSGETAIGLYPKNAVDFMRNVAQEVEADLDYDRILQEKSGFVEKQTDDAISYSASRIANRLSADVIVAFTESGSTARRVSKYRPGPPILALTPYESVKRVLTISWGVTPAIGPGLQNVGEILAEAETQAVSSGWLAPDGKLVLTAGFPFGVAGSTNFLHVMDLATRNTPLVGALREVPTPAQPSSRG